MRFQIEKKELIKHIQHLASIVPSKNTTPILTNYLLEANAESNTVKITTSDLEITIIAEFSANVMESGVTCISAHLFNDIISTLPEEMVDIYKQDEIVKIVCNKIDFSLLCADHTLFPIIPEKKTKGLITLPNEPFQRMIAKTSFAVSNDINRAVLNGVCWLIKNDLQIMAATDGRKVAEIKYAQKLMKTENSENQQDEAVISEDLNFAELDFEKGIEKILPIKTLNFMLKIYSPEVKDLQVVIEPNRIMFIYNEYTIFTHVIEHKYPDYQKAFIKDLPNTILVKNEDLKVAIRRISKIAPDDNQRIRIEIGPEKFEINTVDREKGEGEQDLKDYTYTGTATAISFNFKYMISILDSIDTEKVKICLGTQKDPIMIYNENQPENQEITYLLMPLRS